MILINRVHRTMIRKENYKGISPHILLSKLILMLMSDDVERVRLCDATGRDGAWVGTRSVQGYRVVFYNCCEFSQQRDETLDNLGRAAA